jgi:hypothetical protein
MLPAGSAIPGEAMVWVRVSFSAEAVRADSLMHVRHAASFGATSAHRLEARAARIGGPLIPGSTKKGSHFVFNGALQDQACTQPTHLGQSLAIPGQSSVRSSSICASSRALGAILSIWRSSPARWFADLPQETTPPHFPAMPGRDLKLNKPTTTHRALVTMFAAGQLRRSLRLDNSFPSAAQLLSTTQSWPSHLYPGHSLPTPTPCATSVRGPSTSGFGSSAQTKPSPRAGVPVRRRRTPTPQEDRGEVRQDGRSKRRRRRRAVRRRTFVRKVTWQTSTMRFAGLRSSRRRTATQSSDTGATAATARLRERLARSGRKSGLLAVWGAAVVATPVHMFVMGMRCPGAGMAFGGFTGYVIGRENRPTK